jgi:hypothetical protein
MFFVACCSWGSVMLQLLEADLTVVVSIVSVIAKQLLSNLFIYFCFLLAFN